MNADLDHHSAVGFPQFPHFPNCPHCFPPRHVAVPWLIAMRCSQLLQDLRPSPRHLPLIFHRYFAIAQGVD